MKEINCRNHNSEIIDQKFKLSKIKKSQRTLITMGLPTVLAVAALALGADPASNSVQVREALNQVYNIASCALIGVHTWLEYLKLKSNLKVNEIKKDMSKPKIMVENSDQVVTERSVEVANTLCDNTVFINPKNSVVPTIETNGTANAQTVKIVSTSKTQENDYFEEFKRKLNNISLEDEDTGPRLSLKERFALAA